MEPQFAEPMPSFKQAQEDDDGVVSMVVDIDIVLFGSLVFLGVVFVLGLVVNLPAAVIYCRSRQIRTFTDKFILFVLIVDLLSLLIFIPFSFIYVLEYSVSVDDARAATINNVPVLEGKTKPFFLDDEKLFVAKSEENDGDFSSYCVQQWIFLIHKLIFIMAANLSVLGALKIAVERYLAVVAPLHYHKILKSSVIFFVSLFSFILSLACAVITAVDPADFSGSFLLGGQCSLKYFDQSPSSWSPTTSLAKNRVSSISIRFDAAAEEKDVDDSSSFGDLKEEEDSSILKSLPEAVPAAPYPYQSLQPDGDTDTLSSSVAFWWWPVLKLVHASVFYLVPVTVMLFMYLRIRTEARKQNHRMTYRSKGSFMVPPAVAAVDVKKPVGCSIDTLHQVFGRFKLVQRIRRKTRINRAARVAVLTIGLSVVCFGPLFFVQIFSAVASLTKSHFSSNPWAAGRLPSNSAQGSEFVKFLLPTLLACLHPLLSPLVYVYRYKRVRNELKVLLKSMISKCCFCCCKPDSHTSASAASTDCQEIVRQLNHLAQQKLPPSPVSQLQMLESQSSVDNNATTMSTRGRAATTDSSGGDHYLFYASSQHPQHLLEHEPKDFMCEDDEDYNDNLVERQEYSADVEMEFSDVENQRETAISMMRPSNSGGGFLSILNSWMSSYSRRWNQHRESVTSTASFITLLSNRSRSIPSSAADII